MNRPDRSELNEQPGAGGQQQGDRYRELKMSALGQKRTYSQKSSSNVVGNGIGAAFAHTQQRHCAIEHKRLEVFGLLMLIEGLLR